MLCQETLVVLQFTHNTPSGYFNAVYVSGVHLSCGELILMLFELNLRCLME